jgi:outer membrane protein
MIRFKHSMWIAVAAFVSAPLLRAQVSNVAVVDFERAVVESVEGKKASDKFNVSLKAKQADVEKRQKDLEDNQKKLANGTITLSATAKADLQRDIDRRTLELQRINEDTQKELQALRDELLRPIAERATAALNAMAAAEGYTLVIDISNPENNVIWANPKNDITAELVKRLDAAAPKEPVKTEAPKATTPSTTPAAPPAPPKKP